MKNFGCKQQGSTFGLVFGQLAVTVRSVGTDESGLGCWFWMHFQGHDGHVAQVVMAYMPCTSKQTQVSMVYQQHCHYLDSVGRQHEHPRQAFHRDLVQALGNWQQKGERLVLFIDVNEDTTRGELNLLLTGGELNMQDSVCSHYPSLPATSTFWSGSWLGWVPIDAVYVMADIPIEVGTWMAVRQCPGDHRFCIIDIQWKAFVGENLFKITRPQAWHLNSQIPNAQQFYMMILQENTQ